MKKLLIVNSNLQIGGVQQSLVNLLREISGEYDVTLALFSPYGQLKDSLPENVKVTYISSPYRFLGIRRQDLQGQPVQILLRSFYAGICRIFGRTAAMALMAPFQKKLKGFDVAISFVHDGYDDAFYGGCNSFVLRHVQAEKKLTFLHGDYVKCGGNTKKNAARYRRFDTICACSQGCADSFLSALPELKDKVRVVPNCHDFDRIRALAQTSVSMDDAGVKILSVARFGAEKAIDRAVEALAACQNQNYHYYIAGDGPQRPQVEAAIEKHRLQDKVTLLGEQTNPFGFMVKADLLLIPSVSEAAPMVIGEAACLGLPVLTTKTSSAVDMVENTGYGWVCENSHAGITAGVDELLQQPELLRQKKEEMQKNSPDNRGAITAFFGVIEQ